jgi:superfamily II DNA or RNA helicase
LVEEDGNQVFVPRGFVGKLLRFCKDKNISNNFHDTREKKDPIKFNAHINLKDYQEEAFDQAIKKDFGVIVAPQGSGKTVLGLAMIVEKRQPALIIVHSTQLADQGIDRIEDYSIISLNC